MIVSKEGLEALRSRRAEGKDVSLFEIEAFEKLVARRERLESNIRSAFADCRLGEGIGLFEAHEWDMCMDRRRPQTARARDERKDWRRIEPEDLTRCCSALNFTDALGHRFLLPSFMLAHLNGYTDGLTDIHLARFRDEEEDKVACLDAAQIGAIIEFLQFLPDDPYGFCDEEDLKESLSTFWLPLLQVRKRQAEQGVAPQSATRSESGSEGDEKPQPDSEPRPR